MKSCPQCEGTHLVKNGKSHSTGKQSYKCKDCGRQFVEQATKKYISKEQWEQVDKLLKEKISLRGIVRITGISGTWLQRYVNQLYEKQALEQTTKKKDSCG